MERTTKNYIIDVGLAISFIGVAITGIIKFPGIREFLGFNYADPLFRIISKVHDWSGVVMVVLVLIHLILHREWIVAETKNLFGKKE